MEASFQVTDDEIKEARVRLWNLGILEWKLSVTQKAIYDFIKINPEKTLTVNCSRRLGKSYLLTVMAIEQCLKHPKSIVKFIQPEVKMIRTNVRPIMEEILQDCPRELRPVFKTMDNHYVFSNGSEIHLAGTDSGNAEKIRGGNSHLCLVDEAGFCSDLKYIINSILAPTTLLTKGKIILSSTTPPNPDHQFCKQMEKAEMEGTLIKKTIYDAYEDDKSAAYPRITKEIIADIVKSYTKGADDDAFRTEFLCEVIDNSSDAVVPEFDRDSEKDICIPWPRPIFYDCYTSMDIGFEDLTVVLFGYWDFENAVLVIEDEFVINGPELTHPKLAESIRQKEADLWTDKITGEQRTPFLRVSDNNLILINDLQMHHGLTFIATEKHNKDAYIGQMRRMIQERQIIIHPKCKTLITHLKKGTWDKSRKSYRRSPDNGHYDAIDALAYMVRNVDFNKNPYPRGYRLQKFGPSKDVFVSPHYRDESASQEIFKKIFKPLRKG